MHVARTTAPDVVVMDIRMPHHDGLSAAAQIAADPELQGTRLLILTTFETKALGREISGRAPAQTACHHTSVSRCCHDPPIRLRPGPS
ncbi:response regulator [Streptomyces sp. NPDC058049]|uniref:response regulator n=1 Tax=Streptomyces sp. NPDC058049 TaxID=3346314 RepID=UPI0036EAB75B